MPIIYLRHAVHGTKVATMIEEAEADAQNGWIEYNPDTPAKTEVIAEAAPVNTLDVKRRRKD
jgi:hypothetical protein